MMQDAWHILQTAQSMKQISHASAWTTKAIYAYSRKVDGLYSIYIWQLTILSLLFSFIFI